MADFFSNLYYEFIKNISWPKWSELKLSTFLIATLTIFLSFVLYEIDTLFIFIIKKLF